MSSSPVPTKTSRPASWARPADAAAVGRVRASGPVRARPRSRRSRSAASTTSSAPSQIGHRAHVAVQASTASSARRRRDGGDSPAASRGPGRARPAAASRRRPSPASATRTRPCRRRQRASAIAASGERADDGRPDLGSSAGPGDRQDRRAPRQQTADADPGAEHRAEAGRIAPVAVHAPEAPRAAHQASAPSSSRSPGRRRTVRRRRRRATSEDRRSLREPGPAARNSAADVRRGGATWASRSATARPAGVSDPRGAPPAPATPRKSTMPTPPLTRPRVGRSPTSADACRESRNGGAGHMPHMGQPRRRPGLSRAVSSRAGARPPVGEADRGELRGDLELGQDRLHLGAHGGLGHEAARSRCRAPCGPRISSPSTASSRGRQQREPRCRAPRSRLCSCQCVDERLALLGGRSPGSPG